MKHKDQLRAPTLPGVPANARTDSLATVSIAVSLPQIELSVPLLCGGFVNFMTKFGKLNSW